MPALSYIKLTNVLACQGAQATYGVLHPDELLSASDVAAIEEQESLTFSYSRIDATGTVRAITAQMRAGRVLTVVWSDGSFDEWRVGPVIQGRGEKGRVTVQCVPLWLDLVERADSTAGKGWVSDLSASARNYEYQITARTPSSIASTYIIPNSPSWVTLGTVDPTYVIPTLSVSRMTPGALALAVRDALRAVDVSCEVALRRNGTSGYLLDFVTQRGASANTPVFHPSHALLSLQQKADPTLQATRVLVKGAAAPDGLSGRMGFARWRAGAPSGNVIALTDRNGGASPIAFDSQFVGAYLLRVKTGRTFPITASDGTAGTVTLGAGVSTFAADEDVEFRLTEPLTNTRTTTTRYAVSAVGAGTITCGASNPITVNGQYIDWYARVWSLAVAGTIIITTRISNTVAATDVLTVASAAGVTNAHYVEFVQLDGLGERPDYIDHPTYAAADPTGYGIKSLEVSKPSLGVTQFVQNAWMRTWTTPTSPPDNWTVTSGSGGPPLQNSSSGFTRYGGLSWHFVERTGGFVNEYSLTTPPTYLTSDSGFFSARTWVYFATWSRSTLGLRFRVYARTVSGGVGATLGTVDVYPLTSAVTGAVYVDVGTWLELKIDGMPIGPTTAPYGVAAVVDPYFGDVSLTGSDGPNGYVDVVEMYPFASCPSADYEFGDATSLLQAGNNQLRTVASPPLYYTIDVLDLERAFPSDYPRLALTLGGNVRAADIEYGIDTTVRLLKIERDLLTETKTTLTLSNRPALFTNAQSKATTTQSKIIAAVQSSASFTSQGGPAFVQLTGTTATLTTDAEIATPTAGVTTSVVLPAVTPSVTSTTDDAGASVTFVPPNTVTTPTVTVTAGSPPSRRFPRILEE